MTPNTNKERKHLVDRKNQPAEKRLPDQKGKRKIWRPKLALSYRGHVKNLIFTTTIKVRNTSIFSQPGYSILETHTRWIFRIGR